MLRFDIPSRIALIPILEHLHIIKVLMHANAAIMFKDYSIDVHFNCNDAFTV